MDHTWTLFQAPMTKSAKEHLYTSETKRTHVFDEHFQKAVEEDLFPEFKLKMDGLRQWTEEAIKGDWEIFKNSKKA